MSDALTPAGHPLPEWGTSFVGRAAEIQHVTAMLQRPDRRLVTLFGPGGVGKTRLACELARRMADLMPVSFVTAEFAANLEDALATQLAGFVDRRGARREQLAAFLGAEPRLLVLDNLDHLAGEAESVAELVSRCPDRHWPHFPAVVHSPRRGTIAAQFQRGFRTRACRTSTR